MTHPRTSMLRFTLALGLMLLTGGACAGDASGHPSLIPLPAKLDVRQGAFALNAATRIHADGEAKHTAALFGDFLARSHGLRLRSAARAQGDGSGIVFAIDPALSSLPDEGYTLDITPARVLVRARDARGLQHGAMTLWQLLIDADGKRARAPALHIEDAPRFPWRGMMLDSARHFRTVAEVKQLLDAMAMHKLNVFHWHLTDDQGWRVEIKRYPRLTSVGGCRQPSGDAGIGADGKPVRDCGWYTQDQIRDVVRYAAQRNIEIVPEIDIPGHATAMIAAYPALGTTDKPLVPTAEWGIFVNLINTEEETMVFLENVYAEVAGLFPGRYIHVGGDEATKDQWIASPRVQAQMKALGYKTEMQMQSRMVARIEKALASHGKRLIGWDEILEGELPASATVMSWRGTEGGLKAAGMGHDVVMSPASHLYLDYLQTTSPNEISGRPTTIEMRKIYDFEPVPADLAADKRQHILGLQANVWAEHMRTYQRVQHAIFPRIAAVAEVGWSPAASRNYDDFTSRLPDQLQRYRALGISYAKTPFEVRFDVGHGSAPGTAVVALDNALGYRDIRYTTDGSAPTTNSPRYIAPVQIAMPKTVRAAAFVDGKAVIASDRREITRSLMRTRSDEELAMCNGALTLRLEDDTTHNGRRAIFQVDIFKPCWEWKQAQLGDVNAIEVRAGRIPYFFQLAHDESGRKFEPAQSAYGEVVIKTGCAGPVLATAPLPKSTDKSGFLTLTLPISRQQAAQDLCLYFTGDTRPEMWVLDRVRLLPQ